jgi:hypothetical protein
MVRNEGSKGAAAKPTDIIRRMAGGFAATQVLNTAAKLAIADHLAAGPCSSATLTSVLAVHPEALYRFLRLMVVLELLAEEADGGFALTPLGQLLRADHPESMRDLILYWGQINYPTAQAMEHSVRTGTPAFDKVFGAPFFEYFARHLENGRLFNGVMAEITRGHMPAIIAAAAATACSAFARAKTVVDVGGGTGLLLATILSAHQHLRGVLLDTPAVIDDARSGLEKFTDRLDLIAGDILAGPLPRYRDLYLLSNVIHDWDDARAITILRNCRKAMTADARLLVIEKIMPSRVADSPDTVADDFAMLLLTGGKERTAQEYRGLLEIAGLQIATHVPLNPLGERAGGWAMLEAKRSVKLSTTRTPRSGRYPSLKRTAA